MAIFFSSFPPDSQIECAYATSESCLTKWETRNKMFAWPREKFMIHVDGSDVQGDPYGRGKDYVDIKFKLPSQAWVAGQTYS